ncbi:hypothetical protein B0T25DRAFT_547046 [Lasiosphaeria hispida]|uniref:DUF6594 domain-containing protein n=1 Tax=Lasiosphaeria hispida TaxID=260671 RepID=A0AAJ0HEH7_9PEZI|nr:hypothetical protein B0T25DRAFT_547046 [Lasiosphaeria hispida]
MAYAGPKIRLGHADHGTWAPDNDTPCSLMTFQFDFRSFKMNHRVKKALITIAFADRGGDGGRGPEVIRFAPDGVFAVETTSLTTEYSIGAGITGTAPGIGISVGGSRELREEITIKTATTITSKRIYLEKESGSPDAVQWDITEDPTQLAGLPPIVVVAVLVRRDPDMPPDRDFLAKVRVDTEEAAEDFPLQILGGLAPKMFRGKSSDERITISPSAATPSSIIEPNRLDNLQAVDLHDLAGLSRPPLVSSDDAAANIEKGGVGRFTLIRIDEGATREQKLFHCARGLYDAAWYKFRRFETLSLLSLYHYQDKLVQVEKKINEDRGQMTEEDISNLATMLRNYYDALQSFKKISTMDRPPHLEQNLAAQVLSDKLNELSYASAGELGMVDLTPATLGASSDPVRVLLQRYIEQGSSGSAGHSRQQPTPEQFSNLKLPPGKPNPSGERVTPLVDKFARLFISLIGGAFLLAPMYALTFIRAQKDQLITVGVFVVFFAVIMAAATKSTNQELLTATATYAAVLVVFISQAPTAGN